MRWRTGLLLGTALIAPILVTGCVSIPTSSDVHAAGGVNVEDDSQPITNVVVGPSPGESPDQVVLGFYRAMLGYPKNTDTVTEFLTTKAASDWNPDALLTVYDALGVVGSGRRITVSPTVTGTVDNRGTWSSAVDGADLPSVDLILKKVGGEWRITNPPDGTWVTTDYFTLYYRPYSMYFFDPSRTILTPDPVYIQVGDSTATQLVKDLLMGPTRPLQGAVNSAIPTNTQLEVAVTVSDRGVADVPLSDDILKVSGDDRTGVAAQLAWTLRQVPAVSAIAITVNGAELTIPDTESPFDAEAFAGYDPAGLSGEQRLFALATRGLTAVSEQGLAAVPGPIGQVTRGRSFAVQTSGQLAAIVLRNGKAVRVGDMQAASEPSTPATWFEGTNVLRPSWDAVGVLWVVDRTKNGAHIWTVTARGAHRIVQAPGLDGADILAFAVSRDGVRFAAVVERGGQTRLEIATIVRDGRNRTRAVLRRPIVVMNDTVRLTDIRDVAWVSPTALAVLARARRVDIQPYQVAIDGSNTEATSGFLPAQPTSIAAGPNATARIAIGAPGGQVFVQNSDRAWNPVGVGRSLRAPAYPG